MYRYQIPHIHIFYLDEFGDDDAARSFGFLALGLTENEGMSVGDEKEGTRGWPEEDGHGGSAISPPAQCYLLNNRCVAFRGRASSFGCNTQKRAGV